jgi:hypothetical protein
MSPRKDLLLVATLFAVTSCGSSRKGPDPIGTAFVGPSTLNLRQELTQRSPMVATVKHGESVEVLRTRRRFVQVRTADGSVGWTDSRQLMNTEEMQQLRDLAERGRNLPSQGAATVYDVLNVHTEPNRTSPSFTQITEKVSVDVIDHKLLPRIPGPVRPLLAQKKAPVKAAPKKRQKNTARVQKPPMPSPPGLPANWQELSKSALPPELVESEPETPLPTPKPVPVDDWALVRMKDGRVGWVLFRMLILSIPDEVAQYAEGHRITSYFALADIPDQDQMKHAWLWTTIRQGGQPFEFDGFRVFTWSARRHRYETVYRERDLKGYYPVTANRASGDHNVLATFSLVVEKDGNLERRTYSFNGYRVNLVGREPYSLLREGVVVARAETADADKPGSSGRPWFSRLGARIQSWFR